MDRPHIHVNVAASADGKIDTVIRKGATISSAADKIRVDTLRAAVDAVLVGGHTLLSENPGLTVKSPILRLGRQARQLTGDPAKVGVVSKIGFHDLPGDGPFLSAGDGRRFIFTTRRTPSQVITRLKKAGVHLHVDPGQRVDLTRLFKILYAEGFRLVLVEGGGTLIAELFCLGLVDELSLYLAPLIFGGASAPTLADGSGFSIDHAPHLHLRSIEQLDQQGGVLLHYLVDSPL